MWCVVCGVLLGIMCDVGVRRLGDRDGLIGGCWGCGYGYGWERKGRERGEDLNEVEWGGIG